MATFNVTKFAERDPVGILSYPSALPKFSFLGAHASDAAQAAVADNANYLGVLDKAMLSAADHKTAYDALELKGWRDGDEGELPYKAGAKVTIVAIDEAEIAGTDWMATGEATGAITSSTSVGTKLALASGKLRVAQSGDLPIFVLTGHLGNDDDGAFTIRLSRLGA